MSDKTSVRIGISEEIPKESIFQSIKKRNGTVVAFDKKKITNAIYTAAKAIGGDDRELAEKLANEVVLFLYTLKGNKVPEIEEVQDAVEKILIESGHARTAKAYILYRKQREILRKKKLFSKLPEERDTTDYALFVRTSDDDFVSWDRARIVNALQDETGLENRRHDSEFQCGTHLFIADTRNSQRETYRTRSREFALTSHTTWYPSLRCRKNHLIRES
jgi:hypothetical protein